jgi:16S rRNA (cytosine967-C5)-methyltransferase
MTSRELSYLALMKFDTSQDQISRILEHLLHTHSLSNRDKKFYFNLTNGVLRHRNLLDWKASNYYHGKYAQVLDKVKNILRLAVYEIDFLDFVPPHATVNEYVNLARKKITAKSGSLVNAILRNYLRDKNPPDPQKKFKYKETQLSVQYSYPEWLINRWLGLWGSERTESLCQVMNQRPEFDLHINQAKITASEFEKLLITNNIGFKKSDYFDQVYKISDVQAVHRAGFFHKGICRVQDESGRLVVELLAPKKNSTVLDACAAPGSKYTALYDLCLGEINLIGMEVFSDRLVRLRENCSTWQINPCHLVVADGSYPPFNRVFDHILLDAPCSGLGTIRKNPDIKWRRSEEEISGFEQLQLKLMNSMANLIKSGGTIVYSTCTLEPRENEELIYKFLDENKGKFKIIVPQPGNLEPFREGEFLKIYPDVHEMEGSFAAKLQFLG